LKKDFERVAAHNNREKKLTLTGTALVRLA
jgi:hypothetical protein